MSSVSFLKLELNQGFLTPGIKGEITPIDQKVQRAVVRSRDVSAPSCDLNTKEKSVVPKVVTAAKIAVTANSNILPSTAEHSAAYVEMTRRIRKTEIQQLNEKMGNLSNKDEGVRQLTEALASNALNAEIFKDENYPYYALEAFHQGKIDAHQFGTQSLRWSI